MHQPVVLIDLQRQQPTVQQLQQLLEHYAVVYLFHPQGHHPFTLDALTDLAQLIAAQDVVILEHAATGQDQYDYALVAGQLVALLPSQIEIHLISAMPHAEILVEILTLAGMQPRLVSTQTASQVTTLVDVLNVLERRVQQVKDKAIASLPDALQNVYRRIHPVVQTTLQQLQLNTQQWQKILQSQQMYQQIKATLRTLTARHPVANSFHDATRQLIDAFSSNLDEHLQPKMAKRLQNTATDQAGLNIDPLQFEVMKHLHHLKDHKPKDIYALRDFLAQSFPESDIRRLLKELIDKGYIYCDGVDIRYSHEMHLN